MKPYLLIASDFVKTGGMDRANYALADYLARRNIPVHLVAHQIEQNLQGYPNLTWHRVPRILQSNFLGEFLLDGVGRYWAQRIQNLGGRIVVNGGNCYWSAVNWVHYVHAVYPAESKVNWLQRIKTKITQVHFCRTERRNLRQAQLVIANSERTEADLVQQGLVSSPKINAIYYGIDPDVFYPATPEEQRSLRDQLGWSFDRPIVIFIGALGDRRKGFDLLFTAWQMLCQDPAWDVDLVVVGQGRELPLWQQRSQQTNLANRIQFLGFRRDVPNLLRAADCLIAPTRYEAYGLGVHEALCCGLPALVTQTAGVAERYPTELAALLLPDPITPAAIASKLQHWRQSKQFYRQPVQDLALDLRQYTWDTMAENFVNAIGVTGT